jgi:hypothetical protein
MKLDFRRGRENRGRALQEIGKRLAGELTSRFDEAGPGLAVWSGENLER